MDQNNQESVSNTGIVINKKAKVLVTSKVDKSFISKDQIQSGKANNEKLKEQKDAEKAKKRPNSAGQEAAGTKGRKALFVLSIITFVFILLWLIFYVGGLAQGNHEYSGGFMESMVNGFIPIIAIFLIPLFIILLINTIKQFKFTSNKGFINKLPCIVTLLIDVLTIICIGLLRGFFVAYATSPKRPIYSLSSFRLSTVVGISTFIVGYIMAYALTLNKNDVNSIKLISLFKRQLKLNLFIYGIIAFVFGITYSVVGLANYVDFNIAAFYFGRSLLAIFIFGLFLMAGNIALTIIFKKDEPKFIVQIIIYGVIFVASFIFTIIACSKFTPDNNPNDIKGGVSVCMLINFIFVLGCGVYSFIYNKFNSFNETDKYSPETVNANLDSLSAKPSEPSKAAASSTSVSSPSKDPKSAMDYRSMSASTKTGGK